jgi:hypothetical protein
MFAPIELKKGGSLDCKAHGLNDGLVAESPAVNPFSY